MSFNIRLSEADGKGGLGSEYHIRGEGTKLQLVSSRNPSTTSAKKFGLHTLSEIFLPSGFPDTVSPGVYQAFDSLQAFSSSIAGLLSSRAVLEGFGVGDENASSTNAVLLSVMQDATGRLATILFAWRYGPALAPEAKMYRFAADLFNDSAFVLDCLSPALPTKPRIAALCLAGVLRAVCGVCAGGAKAALSVHFARTGNVGELNAKEASQETVVGLLGMLCGSFVMSHITSRPATWAALTFLLIVHLVTNYLAVRAVALTTLNRQRVNIAYGLYSSSLSSSQNSPGNLAAAAVPSPSEVARRERIFGLPSDAVRDPLTGEKLGTCCVCSSAEELLHSSPWKELQSTSSWRDTLEVFQHEPYILFLFGAKNPERLCRVLIVFKRGAQTKDYLKAWVNAFELCRVLASSKKEETGERRDEGSVTEKALDMLRTSVDQVNRKFPEFLKAAEKTGWNVLTDAICTRPVRTVDIETDENSEEKKDR